MWNKQHFVKQQIQIVKGLEKTSLTHEMRQHHQSAHKSAYRLFKYVKEPDDEFSSLFRTKIKKVRLTPPLKGYRSAEDRLYLVKHDQCTIAIPSDQISKALSRKEQSESIIKQMQLKETKEMMRNIDRLAQQIVKTPQKRMRKQKALPVIEHRTSKASRTPPECCILARDSLKDNDTPLSKSILERYRGLFNDSEEDTEQLSLSPYRKESQVRVKELLNCYKSFDFSKKSRAQLPLRRSVLK
jgi:hypothetical protein